MKKLIAIIMVLVLSLSLFAACSSSKDNDGPTEDISTTDTSENINEDANTDKTKGSTLNLFTWEAMFPQDVLDDFTEETGISVNYVNFDFDETMLAKLQTAKGGDYDVIIADDYIIETAIEENLVKELDKEKISNFSNINPIYQGQFYDKNDTYTVPYGAGVQTIMYNPDEVDFEITGYEDLWNPALKDSLGITSNYRVMVGMALKTMGESYNTNDVDVIYKAGEKLLELAPNIRFIKDDNIQDDLISGEISAAVMYTSQVTMAKTVNPELEIVFPKEGVGFGIMAQFIPINAPHEDEAYAFIDYILRPEVSAKCFEYLQYYCTNKEADALISDELRDALTLPDTINLDNMEMIENISPDAKDAQELVWTAFKSETE